MLESAGNWDPPRCLDGTTIFFIGFSEVGRHVTWARQQLDCVPSCKPRCLRPGEELKAMPSADCPYGNLTIDTVTSRCHTAGAIRMFQREAKGLLAMSSGDLKNESTKMSSAQAFTELRDGLCRQNRYGVLGGINASCTHASATFNMSYRWKTFQTDPFDNDDHARIRSAAKRGPVFVVLEGGGPHHLAKFREHHTIRRPKSLFTTVDDRWNMPQTWIDDYVRGTKTLMRRHLDRLPTNVCLFWKTMHIASRSDEPGSHHPSVVNGLHHWLNRLAISSASDLGIGVLDLSNITMNMSAGKKLTGRHTATTAEGDPYHGFPQSTLMPELLRRMCASCQAWRSAETDTPVLPLSRIVQVPQQCIRSGSFRSWASSQTPAAAGVPIP